MDRRAHLLRGLNKADRLIEIGPSFSPLAPKSEGWNAFTIDHADRAGLVAKYASDPAVDTSRIEDVDFVWSGGAISDAVPVEQRGSFDAFLASHVIEHTTDLVDFLRSAEALLSPSGVVVLAIPDKRKCFDFYRPVSTLGAVLGAYHEGRTRHSLATHVDHHIYHCRKNGAIGWHIDDSVAHGLLGNDITVDKPLKTALQKHYVDAHQWVFTPAVFELIVTELSALGLLDLHIERCEEAHYTEFYAWLRRGARQFSPGQVQEVRLELLNRAIVELADQSRQIAGSPLSTAIAQACELEKTLSDLRGERDRLQEGHRHEIAQLRDEADQTIEALREALDVERERLRHRGLRTVLIERVRQIFRV